MYPEFPQGIIKSWYNQQNYLKTECQNKEKSFIQQEYIAKEDRNNEEWTQPAKNLMRQIAECFSFPGRPQNMEKSKHILEIAFCNADFTSIFLLHLVRNIQVT